MTIHLNRQLLHAYHPMHHNPHLRFVVFALACGLASQLLGHSVYVEPDTQGGLLIRFAEPGKPLETSPGHLDSVAAPVAFVVMDLVPTGQLDEVRVFFRGKPLGGITATLRTPDGTEQELKADEVGYLCFDTDQTGLHHLSIGRHRESLGGLHGGLAYETTSHNAALTWLEQ